MKSAFLFFAVALLCTPPIAHAEVYTGTLDLSACARTHEFNDLICSGKYGQKFSITLSLNLLQGHAGYKVSAQERVGDTDTTASSQIRCEDQVSVPVASQEVKLADLQNNVMLVTQQIINAKTSVGETFSSYGATSMTCPPNDYAGLTTVAIEQSKKTQVSLDATSSSEALTLEIAPGTLKSKAYIVANKDGVAAASQISLPAEVTVDWVAFSASAYTARGATTYAHGRVVLKLAPSMAGPKPQGDYGQF